jgi:hypothetical protein
MGSTSPRLQLSLRLKCSFQGSPRGLPRCHRCRGWRWSHRSGQFTDPGAIWLYAGRTYWPASRSAHPGELSPPASPASRKFLGNTEDAPNGSRFGSLRQAAQRLGISGRNQSQPGLHRQGNVRFERDPRHQRTHENRTRTAPGERRTASENDRAAWRIPVTAGLDYRFLRRTRKNSLFVGNSRGGRTAAILASLTSTCRRHEADPPLYLMQLLMNLPQAKMSELSDWLPDQWKIRRLARLASFQSPSAGS